jgi:multicomponent Na+:H+ antiporter subunit E
MNTDCDNPEAFWNSTRRVWTLQCFVVLLLIWFFLNGLDSIWFGLLAAAAGALTGGILAAGQPHPWRPNRLAVFAGFFLVESLKGGFDVAWRAMHPALKINPCFQRHALVLPAGQPRTLMVAVVSLLPGTLSADLEDNGQTLLIHALTPESGRAIGQLQDRILWLFSLQSPPS